MIEAMVVLYVALFGAAGALLRYGIGIWTVSRWPAAGPAATFAINVAGSFLMAYIMASAALRPNLPAELRLGLTVGLLGAFTTFSTWSYDTLLYIQHGAFGLATANALGSFAVALASAWAGYSLGRLGH